jgi:hypothetical protein
MSITTWILLIILTPAAALFVAGYMAALMDLDDLRPPKPATAHRILILGYHPRLAGGVTAVTRTLLKRMPEARLLPLKHAYGAQGWAMYALSLCVLLWEICAVRRPLVAHLIVASRGDRVRGVVPILLCKAFGVPICAHYHTNWGNLSFQRKPA